MSSSKFSMEFELNAVEIRKLNKMYFKNLWEERISLLFGILLMANLVVSFFNLNDDSDLMSWVINNLLFDVLFLILLLQFSFVDIICKSLFELIKKMLKLNLVATKYKFNFTNSFICVKSPLGKITHKWIQIEKAILTKDYFLLYIKERNGYIISISNKDNDGRNLKELITFVENKVIPIIKV